MEQEGSEQHTPPLQQGIAQQLAPCFALWETASLTKVALAPWLPSLAALALAASQQGASQHAILQQAVLHLDASQHAVLGAAKAEVTNVRARTNPASLNLFNVFSCINPVADEVRLNKNRRRSWLLRRSRRLARRPGIYPVNAGL